MNGSKRMNNGILKIVKKAAASCAAAAIIMTGSSFAAFADEPGFPGADALAAGRASLTATVSSSSSASSTSSGSTIVSSSATSTSTSSSANLAKMTFNAESRFSDGKTHPYGAQTNSLRVSWKKVSGATNYQLYIKGGKYTKWAKFKLFSAKTSGVTIKKLARGTSYKFKVRAVKDGQYGPWSDIQTLTTSRIDFNAAGWKAMCRIVYHEVGKSSDSCWDEPIVHVADCVINRYEAAKYLNDSLWAPYYRGYDSVQSMIYQSGGFMSDAGLASDGASYANVSAKVKNAVYGSLYGKANINGIKHNKKIYYWQNTSYKPSGSKVAYVYSIPWGGYFSIWREYWG